MNKSISFRQLRILCFVAMLSPFLRLLPASVAARAGSAAWVSGALSLLPALLLTAMLSLLLKSFPQGQGFDHILPRILGPFCGKLLLFLWSAWLVFHSGFLLRSGADRFIATIYPTAKPAFFMAVTALVCTIAAFAHIKPLARSAELFLPLLLFVIGMVLLFSLEDVEPTFLLPVTWSDAPAILKGLPLAAEAVSVALVTMGFLASSTQADSKPRSLIPWLLGVTVLNVLLCAVSVGSLGKTYTTALSYPFFIMARDLSIFSGVERIEALVVGLWLLPDFILITLELIIASDNLKTIFHMKQEKLPVISVAVCALLIGFRIASKGQTMHLWSDSIIPAIHLLWAYGVIPLLLLIGGLRKKF